MKAIAINGSPRKGGNTETLLRKVLEPLTKAGWETEFIQLGGKQIHGCRACYQCFKKKNSRCGQKGEDAFDPCLEKMIEADAIIPGSPTYFTDVSAEMKALLDRAGHDGSGADHRVAGRRHPAEPGKNLGPGFC